MKITWKHFFNFSFFLELFLFAFTMFLSIGVAVNLINKSALSTSQVGQVAQSGFSAIEFIFLFIIATLVLILLLKYFKQPWIVKALFYLAIFEGLWFFSHAYFTWPEMLYVLAFLLISWFVYRNIFIHNIVIILAISAIAVIFGLNFDPSAVIIILLFLTIYDFWAVYKTKHMVKMFQGLVKSRVYFSLIIPHSFKGLFNKTRDVSPSTQFMFLGTGDLALPAILVTSSLKISIYSSFYTALGAIAGFIFLYVLFVTQEQRAPMPGLPPIILGTLIGYLISFII